MKDKKIIMMIVIIALIILGMMIILKEKNSSYSENNISNEIKYDEETGEYYILDTETNEVKITSRDKDELQIYIDNPDYNPSPLSENNYNLQEGDNDVYNGIFDSATGKNVNEITGQIIK